MIRLSFTLVGMIAVDIICRKHDANVAVTVLVFTWPCPQEASRLCHVIRKRPLHHHHHHGVRCKWVKFPFLNYPFRTHYLPLSSAILRMATRCKVTRFPPPALPPICLMKRLYPQSPAAIFAACLTQTHRSSLSLRFTCGARSNCPS